MFVPKSPESQKQDQFFVTANGVTWTFPLGEGGGLYLTKEITAPQLDQIITAYGKKLYEAQGTQEKQERPIDMLDTQILPAVMITKKEEINH
jgi:hypothetical protein